jgi:hydrogenase nickel incorporation protein HypB
MCGVCGCGNTGTSDDAAAANTAPANTAPAAPPAAGHHHHHLHHHEPTTSDVTTRVLQLEQDILHDNNHTAAHVRAHLQESRTLALNLVSSPGSGKTTLLVETLKRLQQRRPVAVIEGDQHTSLDAERIRATGVAAVQVNTGKGCHLDARMVHDALHALPPLPDGVLLIENVGNLVCPAGFDLGEHAKVLLFSVTEGEDKPLKYADMFAAAGLVLLSKCDLLPHLTFDVQKAKAMVAQVCPDVPILLVSATTGEGMDAWLSWIEERLSPVVDPGASVDATAR